VKDLAATLKAKGIPSAQAEAAWREFDQLRTLEGKQRFVTDFGPQHP
jgi:hypothetical protein